MELKTYQQNAIAKLDLWLETLEKVTADGTAAIQALEKIGSPVPDAVANFPAAAWETLKNKNELPRISNDGSSEVPAYITRTATSGKPIPHVCLKVPTGGGKTLLGVAALERLKQDTGFVLWTVPTRAIYDQTINAFKNREHPYRQMLDRISGKKLKLLEKDERFTLQDVEGRLCVMMLMLPSANRQKFTEFLKIFRDSSGYSSFFPAEDDVTANAELAARHKDLEKNSSGTLVKQSLINVLKLVRPTVILDEAHKAYGKNDANNKEFVKSINRLNPSFVLELSATPKVGISNILVDISGVDLDKEEMIKMPIEIHSYTNSDWQATLTRAHEKLGELDHAARELQAQENRYIRPIAVVRVERTDKETEGKVHANDAKKYLMKNLKVPEEQIRKQSSSEKELAGEDLLDEACPVRWIITKDALKEGWDCPFAYLLVLLDNTSANTAITQLVGRVMRQPHVRKVADYGALNRCYIHCFNTDVGKAIKQVKTSLENEGLTGLGNFVTGTGEGEPQLQLIERRPRYKTRKIFLPQVLHKDGNKWRLIDYDRDILSAVPWGKIGAGAAINLADEDTQREIVALVNARGGDKFLSEKKLDTGERLDLDYFVRRLTDDVPNPWQAARIAQKFMENHSQNGERELLAHRLYLSEKLRQHVKAEIEKRTEEVFRRKVKSGDVRFYLETDDNLDYELDNSFEVAVASNERALHRKHAKPIQRSLFTPLFESSFNNLEKDFALYLDEPDAIFWWHRIAARQAYYLQGWRRDRVYPDFIAYSEEAGKLMIMETKGMHLKGNEDTDYKVKLLRALEEAYKNAHDHGKMKTGNPTAVLRMMFADDWKERVSELIPGYKTN